MEGFFGSVFRDSGLSSTMKMKPVLSVILVVLCEIVSEASPSNSGGITSVNHNRLFSDATLRKKSDPYYDDFLDLNGGKSGPGMSLSGTKRSRARDRDHFDSEELERIGGGGGVASGHPLSISAKENMADLRDTTGCPQEFLGLCKCDFAYLGNIYGIGRTAKKYTVNCTRGGFTSAKVLENIPENTEALIFTGNNIPGLPANIFGTTRTYPDLVHIDLSSNGIETILGKTFHRVNSTQTLILNNNKISRPTLQVHQRIFSNFVNLKNLHLSSAFAPNPNLVSDLTEIFTESNLTKLEKLHLENNGIDFINENFCELPSLMDLHIAQNELSDLNLDLDCLDRVRYIDLTYNKIKSVGENSGLWKLLHEKNREGDPIRVNLWNNPFECDCKLDKFLGILHNWTKVNPDMMPYGKGLTCKTGFPKNNTGEYLVDVTYTECPLIQASDYGSTAVSAIAWILGICFLLAIGYFLHSNQNLLCRPNNPLHQTTTQGVKYTTIQEEEAEVAHV